jgi:type II secretory pathway component GspD/PulD (secretin)
LRVKKITNIVVFGGILLLCLPGFSLAQENDVNGDSQVNEELADNATSPIASTEDVAGAQDNALPKGIKIDNKKISLDLKGIDIGELLRIFSMKMGLTIVPSKSVNGRVTIFLNNLTFEDALDVILISQDLACDKSGDMINVMTSGEYEKLYGKKYNEKRKVESIKLKYAKPATVLAALNQIKSEIGKVIMDESSGTLFLIDVPEKLALMEKSIKDIDHSPLMEILNLEYAKPADMKTDLANAINAGTGQVVVDERSAKVVVMDLPDKVRNIKRMVRAFDAETKEVFLDTEVVQVTYTDEYQQGIDWQKMHLWHSTTNLTATFPVTTSWTPTVSTTSNNMNLTYGVLGSGNFSSTIQFLQTYGKVKILSSPRLAAVSGQEAKVLVGERDAYVTSTQSQAQTTTVTAENVQFIDVGVKLNIVPVINDDGYIIMKIKPEISSVGSILTDSAGDQIPIVDTAEAETTIKVKDGAMIMIAGLKKVERDTTKTGWPFLQNIPVLGNLFGSKAHLNQTTEEIIFVTPRIIKGDLAIPGTELEKMVPPDITSDEMKNRIISSGMSAFSAQQPMPAEKEITEKTKGIGEY